MIDFFTNREVQFGSDTIKNLPAILNGYGKKKVFFVVYSPDSPFVAEIENLLRGAGISFVVYDKVQKEPDLHVIDSGAALCVRENCDCVVAIGGGSVIDTAKMISMIATNGGGAEDYQLGGRTVTQLPLLFVAIPTTAGTGAEATKVSVIFNEHKGYKKAAYDNSMIATVVILDPRVTVSLPPQTTAATGMDAITHAIESYTSLNANVLSRLYSIKALELLAANIVTACNEPENLEARANMLLGSYFAGLAIAVGTCLAHIVGQPLGAIYGIPHGDVCAIFLIPSMRLNKDFCIEQYADLAGAIGIAREGKSNDEIFEAFVSKLDDIAAEISSPKKLTQYIAREKIDVEAAVENVATSMAHIKHNPRPVNRELFRELILSAM